MKRFRFGALAAAAITCAMAVSLPLTTAAQMTPPEILENPVPPIPPSQFGPGAEGWVKVRYSVTPDGSATDVRVIDVQPPSYDTRRAVAAVQNDWKFKPATVNGEPVEWHNNVSLVVFEYPGAPREPNGMFARAFQEVAQHFAAGRLDQARTRNGRMLNESSFRLFEVGLAYLQLAEIEAQADNIEGVYAAILPATEPDIYILDKEDLIFGLDYRFVAELQLGRTADALKTYRRRIALEPMEESSPLNEQGRLLAATIDRLEIAVRGQIDREPWVYVPSRRTIALDDVSGRLRDIDVECNRSRTTLPYQEDVEWALPASWGACTLTFNGRRGTAFTVYEFD